MNTYLIALILFLFGYTLNMFYISVLYHRGLTHKAIILGPKMMKFLKATGVWVTGIDPKSWATMHRFHHLYSDSEKDPHSPVHKGLMGVWKGQYVYYLDVMNKLMDKSDPAVNAMVEDIPFEVCFMSKRNLSSLPYVIHALVAILIMVLTHSTIIGIGYYLGIMSHPVQGWMVNALAHKFGKRNFDTPDNSRNNMFVGLFVFGEGYQNNHHANPEKASFSHRVHEIDLGYFMCWIGEKLGLYTIKA
ncbi:MAG: fatty acid desaturase [Bacteriovoracaceae bacterium]